MPNAKTDDEREKEAVDFVSKLSSWSGTALTGTLGTGSIFGLKGWLVRDDLTHWISWLTVACFAVAMVVGIVGPAFLRSSDTPRARRLVAVSILIAFIVALLGNTILCTLSNL